jgi:hypothetical protein
MQVSKLLILVCLALVAAVLYIATPAIALEHPWEEGEYTGGGNDSPGSSTPIPDPSGTDTLETPLLSPTAPGTIVWWFELILNHDINSNTVQSSSIATPADTRIRDAEHRVRNNGSMK